MFASYTSPWEKTFVQFSQNVVQYLFNGKYNRQTSKFGSYQSLSWRRSIMKKLCTKMSPLFEVKLWIWLHSRVQRVRFMRKWHQHHNARIASNSRRRELSIVHLRYNSPLILYWHIRVRKISELSRHQFLLTCQYKHAIYSCTKNWFF